MPEKIIRIVCLANSRKTSGRCIAGREISNSGYGKWVRPISKRPTHEISEEERRYENGVRADVLEIIDIPFLNDASVPPHTEDIVINDAQYWEKVDTVGWRELQQLVEAVNGPLWQNGISTYHGSNDKLPVALAETFQSSLQLIEPDSFSIIVRSESGFEGAPNKRRARADFEVSGHRYVMQITDPKIEEEYLAKPNDTYQLDDVIICVSLSEPFHGFVFKLIAAVFTP